MKTIPLTKGKNAKVSDHQYDFLNQWKWFCNSHGYAVRNSSRKDHPEGKQTVIYMHLLIHPSPKGFETDHWDNDPLNNQDGNLRTGTRSQNLMNQKSSKNGTSKYKGVNWEKKAEKWKAQIQINKIHKYLGCFNEEIEAAKAYDQAAIKYFGEFANLNFPEEVMV